MRIVFAGTSAFGVPALRALGAAGHEIAGVVTQPDRPAGRSKDLRPPPVKVAAAELGLEVAQPLRINASDSVAAIAALRPDALVVISYGQILRAPLLAVPRLGPVNVHASLLPRHRGASPIQAAILAGDRVSGVTVMVMDEGLDTGPILGSARTPLLPDDTAATLHDRLARLGAGILPGLLDAWAMGTISPAPQDDRLATVTGLVRKEDGRIEWSRPATEIERKIRAFTPWPGAFCDLEIRGRTRRLIIESAVVEDGAAAPVPSGTVLEAAGDRLRVAAGAGIVRILRAKPAGKRSLDIAEFLRGA